MLLTDQTMADQLKLTERRIAVRKSLFGITENDQRNMLTVKPFIVSRLDEIVERFYAQQLTQTEVELVIGDADTLLRLKSSMRGYIQELFSGNYDQLYVNSRLRVGKVHKRIGVSPALYMSAVSHLWNILSAEIEKQCDDGSCSRMEVEQRKISLSRMMLFDVQFVFDTYTGALVFEVEKAKQELENYALDLEATVAMRTKELHDMARQDGLTGLLNQRAFFDNLRNQLAHAARRREPLSLVYFDLNGFKQLNDKKGHRAGDQILADVGESLLATIREVDDVCRYGGDEFCMILAGTNNQMAKEVCQRLVDRFDVKTSGSSVTFSLGLLQTGPEVFVPMDDLTRETDRRMYAAKKQSKLESGYWLCDTTEQLEKIQPSHSGHQ